MQSNSPAAHTLTIAGRSAAALTGVEDVECFNEQIVVLRTPLGALTITGESLNISQLNIGDGKLLVEGEITSIEYSDRRKAPASGFWSRIFG